LHLAARFSSNPETVALLLEATEVPCAVDSRERSAGDLLKINESLAGNHALELRFHEKCIEGN
jgi:hypothetical protein